MRDQRPHLSGCTLERAEASEARDQAERRSEVRRFQGLGFLGNSVENHHIVQGFAGDPPPGTWL